MVRAGTLKKQEWKNREYTAGVEYAEVENAGVGDMGGKCRSDIGRKAVRKEK